MELRSRVRTIKKPTENRARTRNLVIRLSDREREMLDIVAEREQMNASEVIRLLVRIAFERGGETKREGRARRSRRLP
jgi:hypothetical protein